MYFEPDETLTSEECKIKHDFYYEGMRKQDEYIQLLYRKLDDYDEGDPQDYEEMNKLRDRIFYEEDIANDYDRKQDYWAMQQHWAEIREMKSNDKGRFN